MHDLEVKDAILTTEKTKSEIKKKVKDSIVSGKNSENAYREQMVKNCTAGKEDANKKLFRSLKKSLRTRKVT